MSSCGGTLKYPSSIVWISLCLRIPEEDNVGHSQLECSRLRQHCADELRRLRLRADRPRFPNSKVGWVNIEGGKQACKIVEIGNSRTQAFQARRGAIGGMVE